MDTKLLLTLAHLSDDALLSRVKHLAAREREATALLIAHLAELDERRLYLGEGCSSLFTYCTQVLHLSEGAAYGRIQAARAARRFPSILDRLEEGSLTLATVGLLAPHLTQDNHKDLLDAAHHRSKREVEELVVRLAPQPPVPTVVRRLPRPAVEAAPSSLTPLAAPTSAAAFSMHETSARKSSAMPPPAQRGTVAPLAPERYKFQFTASAEMHEKLRLAQALLRHQIPDGDVVAVLDRALSALIEELMKQKLAVTDRLRASRGIDSGSRHVPAEVKRAVWQRDGGRCAFVGRAGRRCTEQGFLEFHHVKPHAAGGDASVENIELRCRAHNGFEAALVFGPGKANGVKEPCPSLYEILERTPCDADLGFGASRGPAPGGRLQIHHSQDLIAAEVDDLHGDAVVRSGREGKRARAPHPLERVLVDRRPQSPLPSAGHHQPSQREFCLAEFLQRRSESFGIWRGEQFWQFDATVTGERGSSGSPG